MGAMIRLWAALALVLAAAPLAYLRRSFPR